MHASLQLPNRSQYEVINDRPSLSQSARTHLRQAATSSHPTPTRHFCESPRLLASQRPHSHTRARCGKYRIPCRLEACQRAQSLLTSGGHYWQWCSNISENGAWCQGAAAIPMQLFEHDRQCLAHYWPHLHAFQCQLALLIFHEAMVWLLSVAAKALAPPRCARCRGVHPQRSASW